MPVIQRKPDSKLCALWEWLPRSSSCKAHRIWIPEIHLTSVIWSELLRNLFDILWALWSLHQTRLPSESFPLKNYTYHLFLMCSHVNCSCSSIGQYNVKQVLGIELHSKTNITYLFNCICLIEVQCLINSWI